MRSEGIAADMLEVPEVLCFVQVEEGRLGFKYGDRSKVLATLKCPYIHTVFGAIIILA